MFKEMLLNITDRRAKELDIEWLKSFRHCAADSTFGSYMDHFDVGELRSFMRSIFEAVLENCKFDADFEISAEEKKRQKLLMQCLVNAANCSKNLRSCADEYAESCLQTILKLDWLQNETFAAVINFSKPENGEMYYQIAFECCFLWNQVCCNIKKLENDELNTSIKNKESQNSEALGKAYDKRSWLLAVFANYMERNDNFLAICTEITGTSFIDTFIDIINTIVEFEKKGCNVKFATGNVKYILIFLEKALRKFGTFEEGSEMEEENNAMDNSSNIFRIYVLLELILELASLEHYCSIFKMDITAAKIILLIIEGILHYDYCKYQSEMYATKSHEKLADRPIIELPPSKAANIGCVRNFAEALRTYDTKLIDTMKISCLELLGILCYENDMNREYFGSNDSILLLLKCMYVREHHNPLGRLYAIAALRYLVLNYSPNQLRLAQLAQEPSAIIERDNLLKELGLSAVYDQKTKKIRLKPILR